MKIFKREMKSNLKALIFWSIGSAILIATGMGKFTAIGSTSQSINELFNTMPKSIQTIMGVGSLDFTSIKGFYGIMFMYISILVSVHAATLGASILSKEERDRTFEFLYVRPINRLQILLQKFFAAVVNIIIINIISFAVSVGIVAKVSTDNITSDIATLMLSMFFIQMIFLSVGISISVVLKNGKAAPSISSILVITTFLLSIFVDLNEKLDFLKYFSPFKYFDAKAIYKNGIEEIFIIISIIIIIASIIIAFIKHQRKDLTL